MNIRIVIFALVNSCSANAADIAYAADIGPNCKPKGMVAMTKEALNPKKFWTDQLSKIQDAVEVAKTNYKLDKIGYAENAAAVAFEAAEDRAAGRQPFHDAYVDKEIAIIDRDMKAFDLQMLNDSLAWGHKCTVYANAQLAATR